MITSRSSGARCSFGSVSPSATSKMRPMTCSWSFTRSSPSSISRIASPRGSTRSVCAWRATGAAAVERASRCSRRRRRRRRSERTDGDSVRAREPPTQALEPGARRVAPGAARRLALFGARRARRRRNRETPPRYRSLPSTRAFAWRANSAAHLLARLRARDDFKLAKLGVSR